MNEDMKEIKQSHWQMPKSRRALDWILSCIIRAPIILAVLAVIGAILFVLLLIFEPDIAKMIITFFENLGK